MIRRPISMSEKVLVAVAVGTGLGGLFGMAFMFGYLAVERLFG